MENEDEYFYLGGEALDSGTSDLEKITGNAKDADQITGEAKPEDAIDKLIRTRNDWPWSRWSREDSENLLRLKNERPFTFELLYASEFR
jgi:hypothetical protein